MIDILIAILAVLFVFGVAINIHEFGHFIVARLFGMRVEAYSFFGLGPRVWGFKRGNTDYRISAIPLGAYVKLYGDESNSGLEGKDESGIEVPEHELYELRPRWQKFLVMVGGPFMNIVLALAIPFGAALSIGVPVNPAPIVGVIKSGSAAEQAGLRAGDRIVVFDGAQNPSWERIRNDAALLAEKDVPMVVERGGQQLPLTIKPVKIVESGNSLGELGFDPDIGTEPVVVGELAENMPAISSGLQRGDWIISLNGSPVRNIQETRNLVAESKGQPIKLLVNRNGQRLEISTFAKQVENGEWRIGIGFSNTLSRVRESVGIAGAASYALNSNLEILRMTAKAFGQVGKGERSAGETFSGPVGIVQLIVRIVFDAGFAGLLFILGIISLNLGIFNLLPIPMLDGGQIMVLGIEKVLSWFGKTLSMVVRERIQLAGLAVILLLMVFTLFNDVTKLFR